MGYAENKEHVAWNYRWRTQDAKTNSFAYSDGNQVASPAFVRKMSNIQTPSDGSYEASGIDLYEYRYAELVLNLAECYAATGDLQKCKETIAILRKRVGIPEGSSCYGLDETVKDAIPPWSHASTNGASSSPMKQTLLGHLAVAAV